tara:strand:+ start:1915 stop:2268 length:354 start_codon:yes stop_codon:yes gene_type:complete
MKITINADSTIKQISIWNGIFDLTKKEIEVLANLIDAESITMTGNIADLKNKQAAARAMGISDYNTLNNYIKRLKDKKVLVLSDNSYTLHTLLNSDTTHVEIQINNGRDKTSNKSMD